MTNKEAKEKAIEEMRNDGLLMTMDDVDYNNGWTRIEPDGSNLPEKEGGYRVVWDYGEIDSIYYSESVKDFWLESFTHYKPIELEKPPIW